MSDDYTYTPATVSCPHCGYLIPAADVSTTSAYQCPNCKQWITPGSTLKALAEET